MLLYTIMALGAWCLDNNNAELDDELYHLALSFGDAESLFASADLTFVQALILFSNLSQKRNKPNTGSNFLGLATRMALSLGLHRELPEWNISLLQREMRRRVWWGLYMFDSGASTTFGRPILLPGEEAMDVRPVLNIDDEVCDNEIEGQVSANAWKGPYEWDKSRSRRGKQTDTVLGHEVPKRSTCQVQLHLQSSALIVMRGTGRRAIHGCNVRQVV